MSNRTLQLKMRNSPGIVTRITGHLFRRRVEMNSLFCWEIDNGIMVGMLLQLKEHHVIDTIIKDLNNICDIIEVSMKDDINLERVLLCRHVNQKSKVSGICSC